MTKVLLAMRNSRATRCTGKTLPKATPTGPKSKNVCFEECIHTVKPRVASALGGGGGGGEGGGSIRASFLRGTRRLLEVAIGFAKPSPAKDVRILAERA